MAFHPQTHKERVIHRLKIINGHLKKVMRMVDEDAYCIDVIHQSQAIQRSLRELDNLILENHLQTCVVSDIKANNHQKAIEEVMNVFTKREG